MKHIDISAQMKERVPHIALGCLSCELTIAPNSAPLWEEIDRTCTTIQEQMKIQDISQHPSIQAARKAYKACGKDPARYRLSAEALLRRVIKGTELYQINNVVDLVNLISLKTGISIGGFDEDLIDGDVMFRIGEANEPYKSIGRGDLNVEFMPLFSDAQGAFGSPTSDSARTCLNEKSTRFLMIMVGFCGEASTQAALKTSVELLEQFTNAKNIETQIVTA